MKYIYSVCALLLLFGIYLFGDHLLKGDLLFHTDIARDFLLIQQIATTHQLTMIGPRAGAIPGVFFGPIWLYLNLPAFLIGNGNPIVIGYFWLVLMLSGLLITFFVAKKVFSLPIGVFATTLFVFTITSFAPGFTQSFLPVILSPVSLYFVFVFVQKKKKRYLAFAAFFSGLLIQSQPAFGAIFLVITFILSLLILKKEKCLRDLVGWGAAFIPLSTYVVFELRHNFLEIRSALIYFTHPNHIQVQGNTSFQAHIVDRLQGFVSTLNLSSIDSVYINVLFVVIFALTTVLWYRSKSSSARTFVLLLVTYYMSFWFITFFFIGTIWDYYHWGFYPLLSILFASLYAKIDKRLFLGVFALLVGTLTFMDNSDVQQWNATFSGQDPSSWLLNEKIANYIYQDAGGDFGYYVYSPDEFGYAKKYALSYVGNTGKYASKGTLCEKKQTTYLIYNPMGNNVYTDPVYWKNSKVNISVKPVSTTVINTITIEKYNLDQKQIERPPDPNIICTLQFR